MTGFLLLLIAASFPAVAFDELNEAQSLVYETPHLSNTGSGDTLSYLYRARDGDVRVEDRATVSILSANEDGRRDVSVDFLSEGRHLQLPEFEGWRGNPVILAMLEHLAQTYSADTGGGALYFRNRIRDAMAGDDVSIARSTGQWKDASVELTTLAFSPFENDPYLRGKPAYRGARLTLSFSKDVPGGVYALIAESGDGGERRFEQQLTAVP